MSSPAKNEVQLTQIEEGTEPTDPFVPYHGIEDTLFNQINTSNSFTTFADVVRLAPYKRIKGTSNHGQCPGEPTEVNMYEYRNGEIFHKHGEKLANAIVRGEDLEAEAARYTEAAEMVLAANGIDLAELASRDGYIVDNLRQAIPDFDQLAPPAAWLATEREPLQLTLINLALAQRMDHFAANEMETHPAVQQTAVANQAKPVAKPELIPIQIELYNNLLDELNRKDIQPNTLKYFGFMLERYALHMPIKITMDRQDLTIEGIIHGLMEKIAEGLVAGEDLRALSAESKKKVEKHPLLAIMAGIKATTVQVNSIQRSELEELQYCLPNYVLLMRIKKSLVPPAATQRNFHDLLKEEMDSWQTPLDDASTNNIH